MTQYNSPYVSKRRLLAPSFITQKHLGRPQTPMIQVGGKSWRCILETCKAWRGNLSETLIDDGDFNDGVPQVWGFEGRLVRVLLLWLAVLRQPRHHKVIHQSLFLHHLAWSAHVWKNQKIHIWYLYFEELLSVAERALTPFLFTLRGFKATNKKPSHWEIKQQHLNYK